MPAKRNIKMANLNAGLYDGEFQASYDCVGENRCKWALFYCQPPAPEDECTKKQGCQCNHPMAQKAALIALRDRITVELEQYEIAED